MCRELLEQEKRPGDGRCLEDSARHASSLSLPFLSFPFEIAARSGRWSTINTPIVRSSSLRAPILLCISRIAPALPSPWESFCAIHLKRANENTWILIHINSCLIRALIAFPFLCNEAPTQRYQHNLRSRSTRLGLPSCKKTGYFWVYFYHAPGYWAARKSSSSHSTDTARSDSPRELSLSSSPYSQRTKTGQSHLQVEKNDSNSAHVSTVFPGWSLRKVF